MINKQLLFSEFHRVSSVIDVQNITSLHTLVKEVQKCGMDALWLVQKNFINLLKIYLCLMPGSISAERVFYAIDHVKTRLHNIIADERLNNLVTCSICQEMVELVNLVNPRNVFIEKTMILINSQFKILTSKRKVLDANFL